MQGLEPASAHTLSNANTTAHLLSPPWPFQIKPDYLSKVEIDALIIGCMWGEDRRAGLFSE